jgi:hypothetical protein
MEIVLKAQLKHQMINTKDIMKARAEYQGKSPGFNKVFIYQKGTKMEVYKSNPQIAQKYRELKGESQPWNNNDLN